MAVKKKSRPEGDPIPNVLADPEYIAPSPLNLQVSRLTRLCGLNSGMAEVLAPMVFGVLSS